MISINKKLNVFTIEVFNFKLSKQFEIQTIIIVIQKLQIYLRNDTSAKKACLLTMKCYLFTHTILCVQLKK